MNLVLARKPDCSAFSAQDECTESLNYRFPRDHGLVSQDAWYGYVCEQVLPYHLVNRCAYKFE